MHKSLKDVDDNIKKITGRDPAESRQKRRAVGNGPPDIRNRERTATAFGRPTNEPGEEFEFVNSPKNARGFPANRFRIGDRGGSRFKKPRYRNNQNEESPDEEEPARKVTVQSSVVATPKEIRTRKDSIETQKGDKKVMDRNRRMFGMILGTLQKFQSEESKRKDQATKRAEIEQKLEEAATKEKEELRKERRELFINRREKQAQIRCLEQKMEIAKLHNDWEKRQNHLLHFIFTKTVPPIAYKPKRPVPETDKRLKDSQSKLLEEMQSQKQKIIEQLTEIDELYRKGKFADEEIEEMPREPDKENLGPAPESLQPVFEGPLPAVEDPHSGPKAEGPSDVDMGLEEPVAEISEVKADDSVKDLSAIAVSSVSNSEMNTQKDGQTIDAIGDQEFEPIYD